MLLNSVLLGIGARHAFGAAWTLGLVLFLATLALEDMAAVFLVVAIIGGTGDFLIVRRRSLGAPAAPDPHS